MSECRASVENVIEDSPLPGVFVVVVVVVVLFCFVCFGV